MQLHSSSNNQGQIHYIFKHGYAEFSVYCPSKVLA